MIIEFIGMAGAGKSTLSKALSERSDLIRVESPPSYRKPGNIPFFIWNSCNLFPPLSRIYFLKDGKYPSRGELMFMLFLTGWHRTLTQRARQEGKIIVLDQGPVYMLTVLSLFGPERLNSNHMMKWWDISFRHWAESLDLLIWLDTPLPVLVERIRRREIWHSVKDRDDENAYQYLESYNRAYESVISRLLTYSKTLKILRLDTGEYSLEETMGKIIHALHLD